MKARCCSWARVSQIQTGGLLVPEKQRYIAVVPREQGRWREVGVAFVNDDGSINVILDATPVGGKFQLQKPKAKENGGN
jgi:hypothetical protein